MILTDREIKIAIDRELINIDPTPAPAAFSSTSVDFTLDPQVRVFHAAVGSGLQIDPGSPEYNYHEIADMITVKTDIDEKYTLPGKELLLAWTKETLSLPTKARMAARVEGKSSLARLGIGIHITAPTIHAGFSGQIQLEIINHGPAPVILRPGMRICQIIFESTLGTPEKGYSGLFTDQSSH